MLIPLMLWLFRPQVAGATDVRRPPSPYVDKGACPFEGCTYREWIATTEIPLVDRPEGTRRIGLVHAGEHVIGLTGQVHSIPIQVHAKEDIPDPDHPQRTAIGKGEAFYVIHYLGEAVWLCWYRGRLLGVENFSEKAPYPKQTWWVQVKTSSGLTGWTISDKNFNNQDRFG